MYFMLILVIMAAFIWIDTNMAEKRNPIVRLFYYLTRPFVWIANLTRNLILLLIFLGVVWLFRQGDSVQLDPKTALVLAPKGIVVNQYSDSPLSRAINNLQGNQLPETRMRDILKAIELATNDPNITALVLNPDFIWSVGLANLQEIEAAIDEFREQSGKPVIALASSLSQGQYYFAALADEIIMDPQGFLFLQGIGSFRSYFKEGLDKLGIDVHLFKVGEYKSAAEPFVRNDMSKEAKEAGLHYMNGLWDSYLTNVSKRRELSIAEIKNIVEGQAQKLIEHNGSVAQMAKNVGLVDQVMKRSFMHKRIAELASFDDEGDQFRGIDFADYLRIRGNQKQTSPHDQIAIVVAEGTILNGEQPQGAIGGESTSQLLQMARLDERVKAVVLRVNSPGGGVFPSEQIRREVEAIKVAGKPIIISMGNVAASGGYWISMTADSIWAEPTTITGSIGIYGMLMNYPKLTQKLGIHSDGVGTTKWVGAFDMGKPLDPELGELIQSSIEFGYQQFIGSVAAARGLDIEMVDRIARGRVWTGKQAKELGLVDHLGGLKEAIKDAAEKARLDNYKITWVELPVSFGEQLMASMLAKVAHHIPAENHTRINLQRLLQSHGGALQLLLDAQASQRNGISEMAHCLCDSQL